MQSYKTLLSNNKQWAGKQMEIDSNFFEGLSKGQSPEYLWIGCSDSRVPANEITGTRPGEMLCTVILPTWLCTAILIC